MRARNSEKDLSQIRTRRGKAVLLGFGLDDSAGHVRYTHADDYELLGGSETTHESMQAMALKIRQELEKLGFSLDNLNREQLDEVRAIVERVSCE